MAVVLLAVTLVLLLGVGASDVQAQLLPPGPRVPPPPTTPPPAPPPTAVPAPAPPPGPPPAQPGAPRSGPTAPLADDGDAGDAGGPGGRVIPDHAQQVIGSVARTPPSDNAALLDGARQLEALGLPREDAIQAAFGRFPIAGFAHWSDDWLYPRWTGPRFRHHLGCDVFAEYGTPLRAPVDGVVRVSTNALGGLSVKVVQPDGTYVYLAHLSALPEGLEDGAPVAVGDVVGFVGDSGNGRGGAPHAHVEVHPGGRPAVAPKPYLDQWVAEAAAGIPAVLAALQAVQPRPPAASSVASEVARIDWYDREQRRQAYLAGWQASTERAWTLLTPLTSPVLRSSIERHRPVLDGGASRGGS
jgi:murein DD-endopeptidase MepM/ murein hydrolase activator NlpD